MHRATMPPNHWVRERAAGTASAGEEASIERAWVGLRRREGREIMLAKISMARAARKGVRPRVEVIVRTWLWERICWKLGSIVVVFDEGLLWLVLELKVLNCQRVCTSARGGRIALLIVEKRERCR